MLHTTENKSPGNEKYRMPQLCLHKKGEVKPDPMVKWENLCAEFIFVGNGNRCHFCMGVSIFKAVGDDKMLNMKQELMSI